jgi:hypothetical protein
MNDKDGNQVRGKRVLYYLDGGRAVVQGAEGEVPASPIVPVPQKPPAKPGGSADGARR